MNFWLLMALGYAFTVLIETSVLLVGLAPRHPLRRRLFVGVWLTLCTYPVVWLVLPELLAANASIENWIIYLIVAEIFAPLAECLLFWAAFDNEPGVTRGEVTRDMVAIIVANLASFVLGELVKAQPWFETIREQGFSFLN